MQNSTKPQAQGDGDPRPFITLTPGAPYTGPVLVHVEKSGPAFELGVEPTGRPGESRLTFLPPSIAEQLAASLVAQTQKELGNVFHAIQRGRTGKQSALRELIPAWTRLLKVLGVTPSGQNRICIRRDWFWDEAESNLIQAMICCETDSAAVKWQVADMLIRGEAVEAAHRCRNILGELADQPGSGATCLMLLEHLTLYTEFAEGRS